MNNPTAPHDGALPPARTTSDLNNILQIIGGTTEQLSPPDDLEPIHAPAPSS